MSERILNGTSAQLGYTVPFTSVHSGNYRTEDKLKLTDNTQKLNITEKNKQHGIQQNNHPGSVAAYDTRPGNEVATYGGNTASMSSQYSDKYDDRSC